MRIRTIKPEFFTHEKIYDAEEETGLPLRLAFIGLWCAADREGRFKWKPRSLGVRILPYDNHDFRIIMDSLEREGFLARYGPNGEFGFIPSFLNHQCINQREAKSKLPDPSEECIETHVQEYVSTAIPREARETVMARDEKCVRCGSSEDLTIDHIFPRSIGGNHSIENLRVLCRSCNSGRPVAGSALIEDLKKDGLTLEDMKRTCMHVRARGEGKGREGNKEGKGTSRTRDCPQADVLKNLWEESPTMSRTRSSKKQVADEWKKIPAKDKPQKSQLIQSIREWSRCDDWRKDDGQYIQGLHLWIKNRKWEVDPLGEQLPLTASEPKPEEPEGWREAAKRIFPHLKDAATWVMLGEENRQLVMTEINKSTEINI